MLAAASLVLFQRISPAGPVLAGAWALVILLIRGITVTFAARSTRLAMTTTFAGLCFLAGFEGGWYLLPACIGFAFADWRSAGPATQQTGRA